MKGKKLLAGVLSAAMVFGTMAFPVFADGENGTAPDWENNEGKNVVAYGVGENNKDIYLFYLNPQNYFSPYLSKVFGGDIS